MHLDSILSQHCKTPPAIRTQDTAESLTLRQRSPKRCADSSSSTCRPPNPDGGLGGVAGATGGGVHAFEQTETNTGQALEKSRHYTLQGAPGASLQLQSWEYGCVRLANEANAGSGLLLPFKHRIFASKPAGGPQGVAGAADGAALPC